MNEFRVVIYTVLLACSIFAIDLNSASATSIDLKIENERVYNVHIVEDAEMSDHQYIAFGDKHIFSVDLKTKQLRRLCEFPRYNWSPLEDHEKYINFLAKKIRYQEGFLYYMLATQIWVIDFQSCINSNGGKVTGTMPFEETTKQRLLQASFARLTGFICDFELKEDRAVVLECDGQMSVYKAVDERQQSGSNQSSLAPNFKLEVAKRLISPSSQGKSSFTSQYLEPNLYLATIDGENFVYGNFDTENALWPNYKVVKYHPETLSVLAIQKLECENPRNFPLGYFQINGESRFVFGDRYGTSVIAEKDGVCIDYGAREFFVNLGQLGNELPFHDNSLRGLAFDGDLIDLASEEVISLGLDADQKTACRQAGKAIDLKFSNSIFSNSISGIFLCDGRFSGTPTSLHIREKIER